MNADYLKQKFLPKICVHLRTFLFLFFLGASTAFAAGDIKIVTWNMCWFPGHNPNATTEEKRVQMLHAQAALKKINPDIFLCQEMASWEVVKELTSVVPGLNVAVVSDFRSAHPDMPQQNVGIATRFPVDSGWTEKWKQEAGGWTDLPLPRGFAFAAIELPGNRLLLTYAVHLKSNYKSRKTTQEEDIAMREESSELLRAHVRKMREIYGKAYSRISVLVGGDFNTSPDDPRFKKETTLRAFLSEGYDWGFEHQPRSARITIPVEPWSKLPAVSFDHFFSIGLEPHLARVLGIGNVSDHLPVEMDVSGGQ